MFPAADTYTPGITTGLFIFDYLKYYGERKAREFAAAFFELARASEGTSAPPDPAPLRDVHAGLCAVIKRK